MPRGRRTLLIIDEAQNLSLAILEELRMLSNINADKDQVLQMILSGQPELKEKLKRQELRQFAQRVAVDYELLPLDAEETAHYVTTRLQIAGRDAPLFTPEAIELLHRHTQGIPRRINILCDMALVYGYAGQQQQIDAELLEEVIGDKARTGIFTDPVPLLGDVVPDADESPGPARGQREARQAELAGSVWKKLTPGFCSCLPLFSMTKERSPMRGNEIMVGLLWHSVSSNNMGVGALTLSHMKILEGECKKFGKEPKFILFGTSGRRANYSEGFDERIFRIEKVTRKNLIDPRSEIHKLFRQCAIVFDLGEGDSFSDIYGWRRYSVHALSKMCCMLHGIPLVLAPQTIGPFDNRLNRLVARILMGRARKTFCRDHLSKEYAEKMGVKNAELVTDVAFALPFEDQKSRYQDGKIHVGMNVSGLLYRGGYTGDNMFSLKMDYPHLIDRLIDYFLQQKNCSLHLVAHVTGSMEDGVSDNPEDDHVINLQIKRKFPELILEKFLSLQ
jgi:hypothetical protein